MTALAGDTHDGRGKLAVVVDDDIIVLTGMEATLKGWGYDVIAVGDTDAALTAVKSTGRIPDIIIADYRLRRNRIGTETILSVRDAVHADVPGVILTGEIGPEPQRDATVHNFGLLHKPVTPHQLALAIESRMPARSSVDKNN